MQIFQQEYDDGISEAIASQASISYASVVESYSQNNSNIKFKALASVEDKDLYYTQSILVSSSWNKNDDIFDKSEIWIAKNSPEDKPTNLEHDEGTIVGHIVSNYPITEDGILIDENTPIENLPEKYHILTGAVIYSAYTNPDLKNRAEKLIAEIENGSKYVSMECFFQGFDYGLINKSTGEFKVLARDNNTAYLTKYLRAYGGLGEHENYKIGRVLRNITFSGKGYVDKPANPDSIIFNKDSFKFLEKNDDFTKSGVITTQSTDQMENITMSEQVENIVVDCSEATKAAESTATLLKEEIDSLKVSHAASLEVLTTERDQLVTEKEEATQKIQEYNQQIESMKASITELEAKLNEANSTVAAYMKKEKTMKRKAALVESDLDEAEVDGLLEKFDSLDDETFAAMTEMMKKKNQKYKKPSSEDSKAAEEDITEALENVETTDELIPAVGGEENNEVESTRAALIDFVYNRLGKKLNNGE